MSSRTVKDVMDFKIPEEMREITPEENKHYFRASGEEVYGIRNEEKHTIIAMVYKKRPLLFGRTASADAWLKAAEKKISKIQPDYENAGYGTRMVDGTEIPSVHFRYTIQGNLQMAEMALYASSRYFCTFEYMCHPDYQEFAEQKFAELLSSAVFRK